MAADMILVAGSVATEDFLQTNTMSVKQPKNKRQRNLRSGISQSTVTVLTLDHRDHLRRSLASILKTSHLDRRQGSVSSIRSSVSQLHLNKLVLGKRVALELLALQTVLARTGKTILQGTHGTKGNSQTGTVQACKGTLETFDIGQHILRRYGAVIHMDHTSDGSTQGSLILDSGGLVRPGRRTLTLHDKSTDLPSRLKLSPYERDVSDGRVRDPCLAAGEQVHALLRGVLPRHGFHGPRVGAVVGLCQTEAAGDCALSEARQEALLLLFCAELVDTGHG